MNTYALQRHVATGVGAGMFIQIVQTDEIETIHGYAGVELGDRVHTRHRCEQNTFWCLDRSYLSNWYSGYKISDFVNIPLDDGVVQ